MKGVYKEVPTWGFEDSDDRPDEMNFTEYLKIMFGLLKRKMHKVISK